MDNKYINLFWKGAFDSTAIQQYEIYYTVGSLSIQNGPIIVPHVVGATFSDPLDNNNIITNTYNSGAGTYSLNIQQFRDHKFYIRTQDSIGQKSDPFIIEVKLSTPVLRSVSSNNVNACSINGPTVVPFYISNLTLDLQPQIGISYAYIDNAFTTIFDGQNSFWKVQINNIIYSMEIEDTGKILSVTTCSLASLQNIGKVTLAFNSESGVCGKPFNTNVYFTGILDVNTIIYTDIEMSIKLNGNNKFRGIQYSTDGSNMNTFSVIKLGGGTTQNQNNPDYGRVLDIKSYIISCPNNDPCGGGSSLQQNNNGGPIRRVCTLDASAPDLGNLG